MFYSQGWKTEDQYIQKFAKYAVEEMEKYNIPASITLAQGLLKLVVDKASWHNKAIIIWD
jgi:hypothetical protein